MAKPEPEENDVPFMPTEPGRPGTTGKPLDTADAPGKADSELGENEDDSN